MSRVLFQLDIDFNQFNRINCHENIVLSERGKGQTTNDHWRTAAGLNYIHVT